MMTSAAKGGGGRRSRAKRAHSTEPTGTTRLPSITPEPQQQQSQQQPPQGDMPRAAMRHSMGGGAPPAGDPSAFLASFFEAQLAQAADEKEAAMTFAEEQLARLNAQLIAAQRECGRLKARNENLEEEHEEITREQAKMAKLLAIEKTRRKNMAAHMETVEKERKAFYRHAADTERHTLNQGRRWEEREDGLRDEMEQMRRQNEELAAAAENAQGLDLALRRSRVEQEAMIAATVGHKKENKAYAERLKTLETELRHERALRIDIEHSRDNGARQREKLENEVAVLKEQVGQAEEKERALKLEIPGRIRMALEDETEEKQVALSKVNKAVRNQQLAELRLKELQDAAVGAARPYIRKPDKQKGLFARLLDEVVDMGGSLSKPDEIDFVDVEDHVLENNPALADGRSRTTPGRPNAGAVGLALIQQALHASDESGTGSLNLNEFLSFYVHLGYFNELWGRFTALRATLTTGDAEDVYMGWDDFRRCCESVGFRVQEAQSRRDEAGELRSSQEDSPRTNDVAESATAAGDDSDLTEEQLREVFDMLTDSSDGGLGADDDDDDDDNGAQMVAFREFLSWLARRHAGQQPLAHLRSQPGYDGETSTRVNPVARPVDAAEETAGEGDSESGVTLICMAAVQACFNMVATAAAKAHGFESVETMAEAARAELGAQSDAAAGDVAVNRIELVTTIRQDETLKGVLKLAETLNTDTRKLAICHLPNVLDFMVRYHEERNTDESEHSHVTWPDFSSELKERLDDAALGLRPVMSIPTKEAADVLYNQIDHNGNGGLSLDEIDTHIVTLGR
jgi:hypothetical protein